MYSSFVGGWWFIVYVYVYVYVIGNWEFLYYGNIFFVILVWAVVKEIIFLGVNGLNECKLLRVK